MFSLNNIDVVDFGGAPTSNNGSLSVDLFSEEQLINHVSFEDVFTNDARNPKIPFRVIQENKKVEKSVKGDLNSKKAVHRETEKQRRREMARLYASLRSLLPPQYIKGKRSVSDHVKEVVNYITDTQKKIEKLRKNRDKLRNEVDNSCLGKGGISAERVSFTLNVYGHGAEILINARLDEGERGVFAPSRIIRELSELGHDIISYVSTKAHGGSIHRIQLEDNNITNMDLCKLQERLNYVINHPSCDC